MNYYRGLDRCRGIYQRAFPCILYSNQFQAYAEDKQAYEEKHFVMWSGGCDSTLLLYELLDTYGADHVVAVSYKYPWLDKVKYQNEQAHRDAFKAQMRLRGEKYWPFIHIEMDIGIKEYEGHIYTESSGLPQACSWLLSIPVFIPNHSYIYEGGIKFDQLTLYNDDYRNVFSSMCNILDKDLVMRQPYLYYTKEQVLEKLFEYGIYDCTWYCEIPPTIGKTCGRCEPCRLHEASLLHIISDPIMAHSYSELAKKAMKNIISKRNDTKEETLHDIGLTAVNSESINSSDTKIMYVEDKEELSCQKNDTENSDTPV